MKIIEIVIGPQGQTQLQTKGFSGRHCQEASRLLELALGEPSGERLTPEFHLSERLQDRVQAR